MEMSKSEWGTGGKKCERDGNEQKEWEIGGNVKQMETSTNEWETGETKCETGGNEWENDWKQIGNGINEQEIDENKNSMQLLLSPKILSYKVTSPFYEGLNGN